MSEKEMTEEEIKAIATLQHHPGGMALLKWLEKQVRNTLFIRILILVNWLFV